MALTPKTQSQKSWIIAGYGIRPKMSAGRTCCRPLGRLTLQPEQILFRCSCAVKEPDLAGVCAACFNKAPALWFLYNKKVFMSTMNTACPSSLDLPADTTEDHASLRTCCHLLPSSRRSVRSGSWLVKRCARLTTPALGCWQRPSMQLSYSSHDSTPQEGFHRLLNSVVMYGITCHYVCLLTFGCTAVGLCRSF